MKSQKLETSIDENQTVETIGAAPAAPVAQTPASPGWMQAGTDRAGEWAAANPAKATLLMGVAAHQASERLVSPAIDKVSGMVKSTFGRAAEAKVEESLQEEAIAQATGGLVDAVGSILGKAFGGVTD